MESNSPIPEQESTGKRPLTGWQRSLAVMASRVAYWVSRHWLLLFNSVVALYVGLAFLAPVLKHKGLDGAAELVYKVYSPACHQMAHRSWFLFGEQGYYPLELTGLAGIGYFEEYVQDMTMFEGFDPAENLLYYLGELRDFRGNERMGYKVALCQRDVAIYLALLLGGLVLGLLRRRVRPLSWQLFLVFGILPIGLDGGYQLITYWLPALFAPHETVPLLRTITGALFGFGLAWMTYPHIQVGMMETEGDLRQNLIKASVIRKV